MTYATKECKRLSSLQTQLSCRGNRAQIHCDARMFVLKEVITPEFHSLPLLCSLMRRQDSWNVRGASSDWHTLAAQIVLKAVRQQKSSSVALKGRGQQDQLAQFYLWYSNIFSMFTQSSMKFNLSTSLFPNYTGPVMEARLQHRECLDHYSHSKILFVDFTICLHARYVPQMKEVPDHRTTFVGRFPHLLILSLHLGVICVISQ